MQSTLDFGKTNPKQAKSFFTQFLTGNFSGHITTITIWQIERWLNAPESSYADDFCFSRIKDVTTRKFLETLLQQMKAYELHTKDVDSKYTNFINKIAEAKKAKYQELNIKEENKATQEKNTSNVEKKTETKKDKIYIPIHQIDETMVVIDIMINQTNIADLENNKSTELELEKKMEERDSKKQKVDDQKTINEYLVKNRNAALVNKEITKEYKEHEQEDRYYEYAKALFIKLLLAH